MNELKIINGQFVKDGQVVKPEFGDRDQIKALHDEVVKQEQMDKAISGVIVSAKKDTDGFYDILARFICSCGEAVECTIMTQETKLPTKESARAELEDQYQDCHFCDIEYRFIIDKEKLKALPID